jgi:DNA-binding transcriptional regulator LsrR (DeoR family)
MIIGISWGTALYQMIRAMRTRDFPGVEIVQLIGATGSESAPTDGPILAQLLSNKLGGCCRYLHAPLVVENETGRDILMQDRNIRGPARPNSPTWLVGLALRPELSVYYGRICGRDKQRIEC